ncbi:MAG: ATP-binding protein [Chloroflexi bacterium]|nr:ATP-binding protein [Chloroflexota bacterium]
MSEIPWKSRWTRDQVKAMLLEQFTAFGQRDPGIERDQLAQIECATATPHAVIISGLRRVGKSTLLTQLARRLGESAFYYLNFEDERFLGFQAADANDLYQSLVELFGERRILLVDEIQNVAGWERWVRRLMDLGFKFYITGSNAALLSRELGSRLTGRYVPVELFPFSFEEFLRFYQQSLPDLQRLTTVAQARLQRYLDDYLRLGGLPESLKYPELDLARTLYNDVLYRDIMARHRLEAASALKELAFYLMSNPADLVSFNKLKARLGLGSVNTIKNFIEYLENSWLIFTLKVYDYSVKRQQIAPKKVYSIDTGLARAVGFAFSPNTGKLLENVVYLALRRTTTELYYVTTPAGYEVDFYLPARRQLIQVVQNFDQPATREREVRALSDAMRMLQARGLILTERNAPTIQESGLTIEIRSLVEWLASAANRAE